MTIPFHGDEADHFVITYRWRRYEEFLSTFDAQLTGLITQWQETVEEMATDFNDEDLVYSFRSDLGDDYEDFLEFDVILKNSFFAACHFAFERQLIEMCDRSKEIHRYAKGVKDFSPRPGINEAKEYFRKLGVKLPFGQKLWNDICIYKDIRNLIVHEEALVPCKWTRLNYAKRQQIIGGTSTAPRLELNRQFCEIAVHTYRDFLHTAIKLDPRPIH